MKNDLLAIGREKQLFFDSYCIDELAGVRRHFHQAKKHPANPILEKREWWEYPNIELYGNVLFDPKSHEFRMFYNALSKEGFETVCLATSTDGVKFDRPHLNLFEHNGRVISNAVLKGKCRLPTVLESPDEPDPQRRYRMIAFTGSEIVDLRKELRSGFQQGYSVFFSPDAIHWKAHDRNPVIQGSDMCTCFFDPVSKEYIALVKYHSTACEKFRRCVGITTSRDFVRWGVVQTLVSADEIDDARVAERLYRFRDIIMYDNPDEYLADIYGMTGFRYEGLRLGLIWLYDRSGTRPPEHGGNDDGIINAQLVYSRDANPYGFWRRTSERRDFIPCGNEGDFDAGMVLPASTVIEVGDEIWFYYTGCDGPHNFDLSGPSKFHPKSQSKLPATRGLSIGLATLRRDGFVSLSANHPPGKMTTRLLTFAGETLEINADSEKGSIVVEILDDQGRPIAGFTKEDCVACSRDAIRGRIEWKSGKSTGELQGKPIRLVFHIESAKLYAFQFV